MLAPKLELVVLQPTPFCNIDCKYCYLPARGETDRLELQTIERAFSNIFRSGWIEGGVSVVWHAGEPMVLPISYYRDAFAIIEALRPADIGVTHSFQTNGTLITDAWCEFIKESGLKIGVSIDGPKRLHDSNRINRKGQGTFDQTIRGMRLLRKHELEFSVIAVLTRPSLEIPEEIFDFFASEGVNAVGFNVEEIESANASSSLSAEDVSRRYADFMERFWRRAIETKKFKYVREIEQTFGTILRPQDVAFYNIQTEPFSILNIDCKGNFSSFSPELLGVKNSKYGDFLFGNCNEVDLDSAFGNEYFNRALEDIRRGVDNCKTECEYFSVCGGGAPANKLTENGSIESTETMFCRLTRMALCDLALNLIDTAAFAQQAIDLEAPPPSSGGLVV